ncbi:PIN domain-containing protein [Methylobacterium sp. W2]|uniref:PIN domain-containing protein n=1 Tax=Methylobacterium sp. W2 TaxID=2598107 RepID=UPI001D0CC99A|nr:PIN domain-containing protein [Methylobacterium sp. W2]MCC0808082.1 PIN domain-containing protein [Methylobacterium sp. W2]
MFANRFTALIDACSLAGALSRNLLLTLAEAEFFRVRWSVPIMDETERAIERILANKQQGDAAQRAARARRAMEAAFEEAMVSDVDTFLSVCDCLPDPGDAHVLAAALKTRASTIVTENLRHFPEAVLAPLGLEARSSDAFLADTIELDPGRAVAAIRQMRERLRKPDKTAQMLLLDMEAVGLVETVGVLRSYEASL